MGAEMVRMKAIWFIVNFCSIGDSFVFGFTGLARDFFVLRSRELVISFPGLELLTRRSELFYLRSFWGFLAGHSGLIFVVCRLIFYRM